MIAPGKIRDCLRSGDSVGFGVPLSLRVRLHGLQYILIEDGQRHGRLQVTLIESSIHYDHEVERRRDVQTLPAKANADGPLYLAIADIRAIEPELVSVGDRGRIIDLLCRRRIDP